MMSFLLEDDEPPSAVLGSLHGLSQSQAQSQVRQSSSLTGLLSQLSQGGQQQQSQSQSQPNLFPFSQSQATKAQQSQSEPRVEFVCHNCGSTNSYRDDSTGHVVCADCFTQSQQGLGDGGDGQDDGGLDVDEVMALAARTKGGFLVTTKRKRSHYHVKGDSMKDPTQLCNKARALLDPEALWRKHAPLQRMQVQIPLHEGQDDNPHQQHGYESEPGWRALDSAAVLPDLPTCMEGMKAVMQRAVHILAQDLLPLTGLTAANIVIPNDDNIDSSNNTGQLNLHETQQQQQHHAVAKTLRRSVQALWLAYLRAWTDGAEHYGAKYPEIRFSLRDCFCSFSHVGMLRRVLLDRAMRSDTNGPTSTLNQDDDQPGRQNENDRSINDDHWSPPPRPRLVPSTLNTTRSSQAFISADKNNDKSRTLIKLQRSCDGDDEDDDHGRVDDDNCEAGRRHREAQISPEADLEHSSISKQTEGRRRRPRMICLNSQTVRSLCRIIAERQGYREAALETPPSMVMVSALLWLAVCRAGITSEQFCAWIATGRLPLMNAYTHMVNNGQLKTTITTKLQQALAPIATFFHMKHIIKPDELEATAQRLVVACRLPAAQYQVSRLPYFKIRRVRFWSGSAGLAMIAARLVQQAGLDSEVLQRTWSLLGIKIPSRKSQQEQGQEGNDDNKASARGRTLDGRKPQPSNKTTANDVPLPEPLSPSLVQNFADAEEVLAVVALAVQLDPNWRQWFRIRRPWRDQNSSNDDTVASTTFIPWNESQLRLLPNGIHVERYLDYLEQHTFHQGEPVSKRFHKAMKTTRQPNGQAPAKASSKSTSSSSMSSSSHAVFSPLDSQAPRKTSGGLMSTPFAAGAVVPELSPLVAGQPIQKRVIAVRPQTAGMDFDRVHRAAQSWMGISVDVVNCLSNSNKTNSRYDDDAYNNLINMSLIRKKDIYLFWDIQQRILLEHLAYSAQADLVKIGKCLERIMLWKDDHWTTQPSNSTKESAP